MTAEQLRGTLPPGDLGEHAPCASVTEECQLLWARTADLRDGERRSVDVDVDLGGGRRLTGTVSSVYGNRIVSLGYSRLKPRQRLPHLGRPARAQRRADPTSTGPATPSAASAAGPKRALSGPLDHRAVEWLRRLVELRDLGLTEPLPVPIATARGLGRGVRPGADGPGRPADRRRPTRVGDRPPQRVRHRGRGRRPLPPAGVRRRRAGRDAGRRRAARPRLARSGSRCSPAPSGWARCDHPEMPPSTSRGDAARPAPSCSRPAPAPARPGPSARWSPATSPRATRGSRRCWSSPSAGPPARSCASGCAPSWSRPSGCSATTPLPARCSTTRRPGVRAGPAAARLGRRASAGSATGG